MKKEFKPNPNVLARMAEAFSQNGALRKTHLHFASRTDWNSFEKYLDWMISKNYVEYYNTDKYSYHLTNRGREMFGMIENLHDYIEKFRTIINV
jgi:predicted transcriptional regulator